MDRTFTEIDTTPGKDPANGHSPVSGVPVSPPVNNSLATQQPANNPVAQPDTDTFRIAIILLAAIALSVVIAATIVGKDFSAGVLAIGSTAIGGLAGILVPSPGRNR